MKQMKRYCGAAIAAALIALMVGAAPAEANQHQPYLSVTTWISNGQTDWNHTDISGLPCVSGFPPCGDPTSVLEYEDVDTTILEFDAYTPLFGGPFFARGYVGVGVIQIGDGNLRDEDFFVGQVLFSSTDSVIADTDVFYVTFDVGRPIVNIGNNGWLAPIVGFQYWREEYEASGCVQLVPGQLLPGSVICEPTIPTSTLLITNEVEWISFRLGAITLIQLTPPPGLSLSIDAVFIPYTDMHNEDSHLLRTDPADLGPAPNVIMDGSGWGFQGEAKLGYEIIPDLIASIGFRYWTMMSDGDLTSGPNTASPATFPLNDLDTIRYGATAGIVYRF